MSGPPSKCKILLVGATGSGKSSSGSSMLCAEDDVFRPYFSINHSSLPHTRDNEEFTRTVLGREVTVVDTPGADNILDNPVDIQKEIREAVLASQEGYDAIVFVTRLFKDRLMMTEEELRVLEIIQTILSPDFWDHGILLFTYGGNYEKMVKQKRETDAPNYPEISFDEFVRKNRLARNKYAIGKYASKVNFAAVKFENKVEDPNERQEMVKKFLEKVDEIKGRNKGMGYGKNNLPKEEFFVPKDRWLKKLLHILKTNYGRYFIMDEGQIDWAKVAGILVVVVAVLLLVLVAMIKYVFVDLNNK